MERVGPLMAAAVVFALAGTGCVTVDPTAKTVKLSVAPESPPTPATQVEFLWQRQLTPLSDAVNDGKKVHGLPGQVFLFTSDGSPAEVAGDIMVMVYDETRRPNGVPPHKPEGYHFTKDVLQRLVTSDERFGRTYALFLMWPDHWKDVTTVRIAPRYDGQDNVTKLIAKETRLLLDTRPQNSPIWTIEGKPTVGSVATPAMYDQFGAPDPAKVLQQARGPVTTPSMVPHAAPQPAGYVAPVQPPGGIQAPTQPLPPPQPPPNGRAPIPIPPRSW